MARETFTLKHNLNALHDAILAARPDLAAELRVEGKGDEVTITAPDEARDTIAAIVAAHDPALPGEAQKKETQAAQARAQLADKDLADLQARAAAATTVAALRAIVLEVIDLQGAQREVAGGLAARPVSEIEAGAHSDRT